MVSCCFAYKQYKFFVDGEWRHDEHEQYLTTSEYGIVNTVLLAMEPDYIPTMLNSDIPSGSNMDVDNDAFRRLVRSISTSISDITFIRNITALLHMPYTVIH